jgi:hypothetical protein
MLGCRTSIVVIFSLSPLAIRNYSLLNTTAKNASLLNKLKFSKKLGAVLRFLCCLGSGKSIQFFRCLFAVSRESLTARILG